MHEKDRPLILAIQNYFGGIGYISKPSKASTVEFRVSTLKDLVGVIIPHFDKYPLITQKQGDFLLFKEAIDLLLTGVVRSSIEGINSILCIKASMNRGLSGKLKIDFPNVKPILRPIINTQSIKNLH